MQAHFTALVARKTAFESVNEFGQRLVDASHYCQAEIKDKVSAVNSEKDSLER